MDGRRQRGDRARAKILDCSTTIASTEGLGGLTIGRVASEAGVSKGNITVLFGDKESLQIATIDRAAELFIASVVEPARRKSSPLERLLALVEGWFDFVEEKVLPGGCFISAASSEYRAKPGRIRERISDHRAAIAQRFRAFIAEAKACGQARPDADDAQVAFELMAFQAAANVAALMGDRPTFDRARRTSLDRIGSIATGPLPGPGGSEGDDDR